MKTYGLAISTCPNDTFIFHALVHGLVACPGFEERRPELRLADVEELNRQAMRTEVDVCKISAAAWRQVRGDYALLASGAALGFGCGPVLVARPGVDTFQRIAIPGENTTAALLLERHGGFPGESVAMRFDRIMPALAAGEVDAGVLIHEGRFVFRQHGLELVLDLGAWWERATGLPIPLGIIVARRDLEPTFIAAVERGVVLSLEYARAHPEASAAWIASLAQELDPATIQRHIETYVTPLSLDMGVEGRRALDCLVGEVNP